MHIITVRRCLINWHIVLALVAFGVEFIPVGWVIGFDKTIRVITLDYFKLVGLGF